MTEWLFCLLFDKKQETFQQCIFYFKSLCDRVVDFRFKQEQYNNNSF